MSRVTSGARRMPARAASEAPIAQQRHQRGGRDDHDLVVGDVDAEELDVMAGEEEREDPRLARVPARLGQSDHQQHEPDRDHERELDRPPVEAAHDDAVDQRAQERCEHKQDEHQREWDRPVIAHGQIPVGEGGQHPDRAMGDVEDP